MSTLIVGGAGYVGGALTDLYHGGVIVYDNLLFEEDYRKENVEFVLGDVRDRERLKPYLDQADTVVWLAGIVGDGACAIDPKLTHEINTESVKWLCENYDGRIIFPSTCSVYGAQDGLLDESSPINPLSEYAKSKYEAESYLKDKNAVIFRLGTLFGVSDHYSRVRFDLVVNTMTASAVKSGKLSVFGGEQFRPLLHVQDVAKMMFHCPSNVTGIFNLHYDNIKMIDLAKMVAKGTGAKIEVTEQKFEDNRNYRVSSEKARRHLNFKPTYSIDLGIDEIKEVIPRIKDLDNPRYSNVNFLGGLK